MSKPAARELRERAIRDIREMFGLQNEIIPVDIDYADIQRRKWQQFQDDEAGKPRPAKMPEEIEIDRIDRNLWIEYMIAMRLRIYTTAWWEFVVSAAFGALAAYLISKKVVPGEHGSAEVITFFAIVFAALATIGWFRRSGIRRANNSLDDYRKAVNRLGHL